jgi:hypothetical protein
MLLLIARKASRTGLPPIMNFLIDLRGKVVREEARHATGSHMRGSYSAELEYTFSF